MRVEEWEEMQCEPVESEPKEDLYHELQRYKQLSKQFENQCKCYEEEIKMLYNRIDALKIALKNIAIHM